MLTTAEILKKVRELEIKSKKLTTDLFTGEYHSAFKGKGMSFKEVREYAAGDDIRFIDWNVSARFGHPFSKVFEEERELTVMMLVDISNSSLFGTTYARKRDIITEIGAVVLENTICEAGSIYAGVPAKKVKDISQELVHGQIDRIANNYIRYADWFRNQAGSNDNK